MTYIAEEVKNPVEEKIQVSRSKVAELFADGVNKEQIRAKEYPTITKTDWNKIWDAMGYKGKKAPKKNYTIVE